MPVPGNPRYLQDHDVTKPQQISVNPFELHGMACGLLCGSREVEAEMRVALLCDLLGLEDRTQDLARSMSAVLLDCQAQIEREDHDFEPLQPDADASLQERTVALARWCDGFLAGFGAISREREGHAAVTDAERDEILSDFAAIAQAEAVSADSEADEWHYFEVREYVRMAAISFFLDRNAGTVNTPVVSGSNDRIH